MLAYIINTFPKEREHLTNAPLVLSAQAEPPIYIRVHIQRAYLRAPLHGPPPQDTLSLLDVSLSLVYSLGITLILRDIGTRSFALIERAHSDLAFQWVISHRRMCVYDTHITQYRKQKALPKDVSLTNAHLLPELISHPIRAQAHTNCTTHSVLVCAREANVK